MFLNFFSADDASEGGLEKQVNQDHNLHSMNDHMTSSELLEMSSRGEGFVNTC